MSDRSGEIPVGEAHEIAPGVVLERRSFLTLATAAVGAAALPAAARAHTVHRALARPEDAPGLAWERFLEETVAVARRLLADPRVDEDHYLHTIASFAVRLVDAPVPELRPSSQGAETFIGGNHGPEPFIVLHWKMAPGSRIRDHAHTYGNVVTVCLEGQARVRNHEMLEEPDFDRADTFEVVRTQDQVLTPGRVNLVPLAHDYVHGFVAGPDGARGLDITTRRKERREVPYLEVADEPLDEEARVFEATWAT